MFAIGILITIVRSIGLFGSTFLIPLFVQQQMGYSTIQSGLLMLPSAIFMALLLPFVGRMADKVGPRIPSIFGLLIMGHSLLVYRTIGITTDAWGLIMPMMERSVGLALLLAPINTTLMNSVPPYKIGMASSMNNIMMQVGASVGIAFFGTSLTNRAMYHLSIVSQSIRPDNLSFMSTLTELARNIHSVGYDYAQSALLARSVLMNKVTQAAMVQSYQDAFIIGGLVVLVAIPLAFYLPLRAIHHHAPGPGEPPSIID